ncbi:PP2C family protein-serine/threonine phosphatase [uncultured Paludibaculum sp.]|uniref:PP2C family protein-serine/threonine phosphatase n=1 Tax=uncultured Paludibaculum sp. TaxID=1765020 RepID=UPI002AAA8878|nr:PP2C family protein-serine/threonine phosphatase [uncultured Paludibaculum sp.]
MKRYLIVAALGTVVLATLAPLAQRRAYGPTAPWTRERAIGATINLAREFGVDVANWEFLMTVERQEDWMDLQTSHPESALVKAFSGTRYRVLARSLDGDSTVTADFDGTGRPLRWRPRLTNSLPRPKDMPREMVVARFGLGEAALFQSASERRTMSKAEIKARAVRGEKTSDSDARWEWKDPNISGLSAELIASYDDGKLGEVDLRHDVPRSVRRNASVPGSKLREILSGIGAFFQVCAITAAVIFVLVTLTDRRDHLRLGLWVAGGVIVFYLFALLLGGRQGYLSASWDQRDFDTTSNRVGFLFGLFLVRPLALAAPLAAGLLLIRGREIQPWLSVLWITVRRKLIPTAGRELTGGMLMSLPLAALPYLVSALLPGLGVRADAARPGILMDTSPVLGVLVQYPSQCYHLLCVFAVLLPWLWRPAPRVKWRVALLLAVGPMICLGRLSPLSGNGYVSIAVAMAMFGGWLWIYRNLGLLALMTSLLGVYTLYDLSALASFPAGRLWPITQLLLVWFAPLVAGFVISRRPVQVDVQELANEISRRNDPPPGLAPRSERERLLTEFAVAREAQQGMLPDKPPSIPGFSLSATCVPAREVGGDLFDFLEMPQGCWALCVADVSGKGVPAALYMTLTKGMLAAEQAMATGLLDLACAINRQLLAAGKRRTFVTLAMGLLDPERRVLEVLRAGHNPILWWRAELGASVYVQPKGIGLGLAGDRIFTKSIEREELALADGDLVVFYSDGLTEAMNPKLELYGEDRLQAVVARAAGLDAPELAQAILDDVEVFKAGADPHDDLTLVVLRCLPTGEEQALTADYAIVAES